MATTATRTARQIVTRALRLSGVVGFGEDPAAEYMETGLELLDDMLKGWQNDRHHLWAETSQTLALTTSASYSLSPVRPLRISSARYKRSASASEQPMLQMTRDEYDNQPNKATTGTPTQFYYDRQREAAVFYVWPVPDATAGQTIEITYERELEDITGPNDTVDLPSEWFEAAVYNLAIRVTDIIPTRANPNLERRAMEILRMAKASDLEGSVIFERD